MPSIKDYLMANLADTTRGAFQITMRPPGTATVQTIRGRMSTTQSRLLTVLLTTPSSFFENADVEEVADALVAAIHRLLPTPEAPPARVLSIVGSVDA